MGVSAQFNVRKALSSYDNLKKSLSGSEAIKQLKKKPAPASFCVPTRASIPYHGNLSGKWFVCQIATLPFREVLALSIKIVGCVLLSLEFCSGLSLLLLGERVRIGFADASTCKTKVHWLQFAANFPQYKKVAQSVYNHPPIPISSIKDLRVRSTTYFILNDNIDFTHHGHAGECRGMSWWFTSLYFRSRHLFKNPETHLTALTSIFKEGAPAEAIFLHALSETDECLGFKIKVGGAIAQNENEKVPSFEARVKKHIHKLPKGVYIYDMPRHKTVFIKINKQLGFVFDPNYGLFKIEGPDLANQVFNFAKPYLKLSVDPHIPKQVRFDLVKSLPKRKT